MTQPSKWPFHPTDGGPHSRPRVVNLENVVVAIVDDALEAERTLRTIGFTDDRLRAYTSEQMLANDEAFRSERGLLDRSIGSLVDDKEGMSQYVEYARKGGSALWVRVLDRDQANSVLRQLAGHVLHVWFYGPRGLEFLHVR